MAKPGLKPRSVPPVFTTHAELLGHQGGLGPSHGQDELKLRARDLFLFHSVEITKLDSFRAGAWIFETVSNPLLATLSSDFLRVQCHTFFYFLKIFLY